MAQNLAENVLNYTHPRHDVHAGLAFSVLYYGVAIPVSYVGNLFTYIIVCKLLKYRDSTSDVLVGGLALNDVLTAIIVFTPSLISAARGQYFGSQTMCEFSAVTTVWYIYTTFAMLVLISGERWLALTRPFLYKRLVVTGFKLKFIMAVGGFFCLMLASLPLFRYPVVLKAGWFCAAADITYTHFPPATHLPTPTPAPVTPITTTTTTSSNVITSDMTNRHNNPVLATTTSTGRNVGMTTTNSSSVLGSPSSLSGFSASLPLGPALVGVEVRPVQVTMYIKLVYLLAGIFLLVASNFSIAYTLKCRRFGDAASREVDRKFARMMGVVAALFLFTWLPNLMAQAACLAKAPVCHEFEFWAMRIVNVGVAVNPFVYGVMKTTYRRGYLYLVRVSLHYLTCTLLPLPTYGEEIFDLRERVLSQRRPSGLPSPGQASRAVGTTVYTLTYVTLSKASTAPLGTQKPEVPGTTTCSGRHPSVTSITQPMETLSLNCANEKHEHDDQTTRL